MTNTIAVRPMLGLEVFSRFLVFTVLLLIFAGALVTSNHAGLAVPDWPTTFGQNMFLYPYSKWQGGIFYEHGHRLFASVVGMLTVVLFFWTLLVEERRWVKTLAALALVTVIVQGVFGGLTVLYHLPPWLSTGHAFLAQTFLALTVLIAHAYGEQDEDSVAVTQEVRSRFYRMSLFGIVLLYVQLIIGAYMRHSYAGLAIPDFPTMAGSWLPFFDQESLSIVNKQLKLLGQWSVTLPQMWIHFAHRLGGVIVAAYFVFLGLRLLKATEMPVALRGAGKIFLAAVLLQFALGVTAVLTVKEPVLTSLHVVMGAALLGFTVFVAARCYGLRIKK